MVFMFNSKYQEILTAIRFPNQVSKQVHGISLGAKAVYSSVLPGTTHQVQDARGTQSFRQMHQSLSLHLGQDEVSCCILAQQITVRSYNGTLELETNSDK